MKTSIYQKNKKLEKYNRVRVLYKQGLTTRDISKIIGMSRQWVWLCVRGKGIKEVEKLNLPDLMEKVEI